VETLAQRPRSTVLSGRAQVIVCAVIAALAVNLGIYAIGRAAGASFSYTQSGTTTSVDALAVTVMTAGPLAVGLVLVALLSRRWPRLNHAARLVAPALALATIALMTVPAGFDTTSRYFLSCMHVVLVPVSLIALTALAHTDSGAPDCGRIDGERR
jgi:hypothetical protein